MPRQPKGNASSRSITAMTGRNAKLKVTCSTRLRVENAKYEKNPV